MPSEAVDIDVGQLVYPSLKDCPVVVDLHELSPVGRRATGRRDGRWFERFAEVCQGLTSRGRSHLGNPVRHGMCRRSLPPGEGGVNGDRCLSPSPSGRGRGEPRSLSLSLSLRERAGVSGCVGCQDGMVQIILHRSASLALGFIHSGSGSCQTRLPRLIRL